MSYAVCLRLRGAGAEEVAASLANFFQTQGGLLLQTVTTENIESPHVRGLSDSGEKLYTFSKEVPTGLSVSLASARSQHFFYPLPIQPMHRRQHQHRSRSNRLRQSANS